MNIVVIVWEVNRKRIYLELCGLELIGIRYFTLISCVILGILYIFFSLRVVIYKMGGIVFYL